VRQEVITVASAEVAFAKIIKSSANNKRVIGGQDFAIRIPLSKPRDSCWWKSLERTSVPIISKKGDREGEMTERRTVKQDGEGNR